MATQRLRFRITNIHPLLGRSRQREIDDLAAGFAVQVVASFCAMGCVVMVFSQVGALRRTAVG